MRRVLAVVDIGKEQGFQSITRFTNLGALASVIIKNAFVLAGVVSFILLVFGGFSFIMGAGSGDTKQADRGKQAITGAVVGLLIVVGSFWIVQIIEYITGLNLF